MRRYASIALLISTLFAGLSYAFLFPLTSLYLVNELGASPLAMGVFMALMMCAGMLTSTWLGRRSDAGWSRKALIYSGQAGFILMLLSLMLTRSYGFVLFMAVTAMSLSSVTLPQLFTLGRLHADRNLGRQANFYIALMRAAIAIAWVVGPPSAFILHGLFGFTGAFSAALIASASVIVMLLGVPEQPRSERTDHDDPAAPSAHWIHNRALVLFLLATFSMFAASNMYLISIPLYVTNELSLSAQWVGNLMGLAAFIEVPVMILAGIYGSRLGMHRLMVIGVAAGCLFFAGLTQTDNILVLVLLQLLNGLFVGITASIGIVLVQDLMKRSIGLATTLFNNAQQAAMLLGNFAAGAIAQWFSFGSTFLVALALGIISLVLLIAMGRHQQSSVIPLTEPSH
ncbi:sugar efflux transporter [Reinekea blandensis]|uniref:Major facilitator superfamily (MFS) profile domain-containing protein n=1 Tax=Reinekea blandensis MED297 TaxID=314283 RepID=A4BG08_9GAMM|nr:sugar efflux transporter [Reinekea blandensis]EAR09026.1 hypothetical protein MED297_04017 [Reinekea sp. MED297] [Reinekea blandensis MED297]